MFLQEGSIRDHYQARRLDGGVAMKASVRKACVANAGAARLNVGAATAHLKIAASLLRGVASSTPISALAQSLTDAATTAEVLSRALDADVMALRDLAHEDDRSSP